MSLRSELEEWSYDAFRNQWITREGLKVPDEESRLSLKNEAILIEGTVLYADIANSTNLVDTKPDYFAAEIYKVFLYCAARIIRQQGGTITAYDGDRIMAVYIGDLKNTNAAKSALKIKWAGSQIILPQLRRHYQDRNQDFSLSHVTGIDTGKLFVAKTGVRGANDLVWIGRAANYAAKLSALSPTYTYITKAVYEKISNEAKYSNDNNMWEKMLWTAMGGAEIYRSSWSWPIE